MSAYHRPITGPYVLAVSISAGGIPKHPQQAAFARTSGLVGDGRNHAKHVRPDRALSLWDYELMQQLVAEGFPLTPGAAGENLTVVGLGLQQRPPGTLLEIGDVLIRLEQPRKPCYVLDPIDPRLKEAVVGRFGYMATVLRVGILRPGMPVTIVFSRSPHHVHGGTKRRSGEARHRGARRLPRFISHASLWLRLSRARLGDYAKA